MNSTDIPFHDIVSLASDIVVVTEAENVDPPGPTIVYVNRAFTRLTGYERAEVIGKSPRILQGPDTDPETTRRIRKALDKREPVHATILNYAKDGSTYWLEMNIVPLRDASGTVTHFASIERNVTEQKLLEERLSRAALTDPLTGLGNRREFLDAAGRAWAGFQRHRRPLSLAMIDLDLFKSINDSYGHDGGDAVLCALAACAAQEQRAGDLVARLGGDEFAVLMPDTTGDDAVAVMERLRRNVESLRVEHQGDVINFTISAGVASATADQKGVEALVRSADQALYAAKHDGHNCVRGARIAETAA